MTAQERMQELKEEIAKFPKGNLTYKTIRGARRMYLQWKEDGKRKEKYIKAADEAELIQAVERRKTLEREYQLLSEIEERLEKYYTLLSERFGGAEHEYLQLARNKLWEDMLEAPAFQTHVVTGSELKNMCVQVKQYEQRECMGSLRSFLVSPKVGKVCLIYGLRRTGKTTMVLQAISELPEKETAYIKIMGSDTMAKLNKDLRLLQKSGYKYIFIDEITLMEDFIDSASLLSDVYAMNGMKIILSGTDSLGFAIAANEELYDRSIKIHTTFIPFREYARLLKIHDIDEYIRYGGTFRVGETDFDDPELNDEGISFRNDETTRRYIDTAIARNIQHSLACYQDGGHFRHLTDLYEADELTGAVNRIIEDMNHRFLISVLNKNFKSHDLGSGAQIERKRAAREGRESILDQIDTERVTSRLMEILNIRNKEEMSVAITEAHVSEIKEYLKMLDLILDCPQEGIGTKTPMENILFTQPGMRYCQAQALVHSLMKDELFKTYPAIKRKEICELILEEVRGRMLEEIVLLETMKATTSNKNVFKLLFAVGEYDMVIADTEALTCEIYEIKHTDKIAKPQYKHLINPEKCQWTEFEYGTITRKVVLYRGRNQIVNGIEYVNVEEYLEKI